MGRAKWRRQNQTQCAYCGAPRTSYDHVPPRCLIPLKRENLITVPSCDEHNNARSNLDERFREFIVVAAGGDTPATQAMVEAVRRSFDRSPKKKADFRNRSEYMEALEMFRVKMDAEPFTPIVSSITRGLYWHHYGRPLGMKIGVEVSLQDGFDPGLKEVLREMRHGHVGGDQQFWYAYNMLDIDDTVTMWFFLFQRKVLAVAITNPEAVARYEAAHAK